MQAYEEQLLADAEIHVNLRDNSFTCPSTDILEKSNLDAEKLAALGCSGGGGGGGQATKAVVGVLCGVVLLGAIAGLAVLYKRCLLYTSPSPRDRTRSRMPSSA